MIHEDVDALGVEVGVAVWVGTGVFDEDPDGELMRYACIRLTLVPCLPW